jgi:hypothetical protein
MFGNPVSIQHQGYARLLSESTLQGTGTHRTSGRQAQTLQAYRTSMREDGAELRLARRACSRLHLDQIRPHGLAQLLLALDRLFHLDDHCPPSRKLGSTWTSGVGCRASASNNTRRHSQQQRRRHGLAKPDCGGPEGPGRRNRWTPSKLLAIACYYALTGARKRVHRRPLGQRAVNRSEKPKHAATSLISGTAARCRDAIRSRQHLRSPSREPRTADAHK